jgi:hypothetical protein
MSRTHPEAWTLHPFVHDDLHDKPAIILADFQSLTFLRRNWNAPDTAVYLLHMHTSMQVIQKSANRLILPFWFQPTGVLSLFSFLLVPFPFSLPPSLGASCFVVVLHASLSSVWCVWIAKNSRNSSRHFYSAIQVLVSAIPPKQQASVREEA